MVDPSLNICVLSLQEAARLENYGVWPACKGHRHVDKLVAESMVVDETYRWLGGADTRTKFISAIVPTAIRMWRPVVCRDWNGRPLMGLRIWGNEATR
jgi:hypothetical protein